MWHYQALKNANRYINGLEMPNSNYGNVNRKGIDTFVETNLRNTNGKSPKALLDRTYVATRAVAFKLSSDMMGKAIKFVDIPATASHVLIKANPFTSGNTQHISTWARQNYKRAVLQMDRYKALYESSNDWCDHTIPMIYFAGTVGPIFYTVMLHPGTLGTVVPIPRLVTMPMYKAIEYAVYRLWTLGITLVRADAQTFGLVSLGRGEFGAMVIDFDDVYPIPLTVSTVLKESLRRIRLTKTAGGCLRIDGPSDVLQATWRLKKPVRNMGNSGFVLKYLTELHAAARNAPHVKKLPPAKGVRAGVRRATRQAASSLFGPPRRSSGTADRKTKLPSMKLRKVGSTRSSWRKRSHGPSWQAVAVGGGVKRRENNSLAERNARLNALSSRMQRASRPPTSNNNLEYLFGNGNGNGNGGGGGGGGGTDPAAAAADAAFEARRVAQNAGLGAGGISGSSPTPPGQSGAEKNNITKTHEKIYVALVNVVTQIVVEPQNPQNNRLKTAKAWYDDRMSELQLRAFSDLKPQAKQDLRFKNIGRVVKDWMNRHMDALSTKYSNKNNDGVAVFVEALQNEIYTPGLWKIVGRRVGDWLRPTADPQTRAASGNSGYNSNKEAFYTPPNSVNSSSNNNNNNNGGNNRTEQQQQSPPPAQPRNPTPARPRQGVPIAKRGKRKNPKRRRP